MNVADAMTPRADLVTVSLPGSREDVLTYLQEYRFSSVPVVKGEGDEEVYRGLVSRDDLIDEPDEDQLALLMREVPTVTPDTNLRDAAQVMLGGSRRVPVLEDHDSDTLAGIVTVTDIVRAIAREEVDADADCDAVAGTEVNTVYTATPLTVAERQLFFANVPYAVALDDDGEMAGVLTEVDVLDVARVVEGEDDTGDSIADQDDDWKWEGIKAVGSSYVPTRNVEIPIQPVEEFMTADVVTVSRRRSVTEAAQAMITDDIEQIPLLAGGELVGVVRDVNLLEAL
ncbi:CBS domain-containing protein [Halobaculum sp. CBA1158]|uniref:CBS domain-containing protein n=1 Tax=Halobaculum sp. CBA1158 TaxID=2904243 RepID=UPI001F46E2BA|nr:CBS domain-containing protein [Halobaculum sp. CBA1158]UIP00059.1 CBS domain-containing protein [Halobaculum sp. CBA1158]